MTKWQGEDGQQHVRLLAADRPDANELTTDTAGALRWVASWLNLPNERQT